MNRTPAPARDDLDARGLIEALHELRAAPHDADWWDRYCALLAPLARARTALALSREGGEWRVLGAAGGDGDWLFGAWRDLLEELAARALANGYAYNPARDSEGKPRLLAATRLGGRGEDLLLLDIPELERARLNELLLRVQLVADVPAPAASQLPVPVAAASAMLPALPPSASLLDLLDLAAVVMRERNYGAAALALVNGVVARTGCTLVALGWRHGEHVRLEAISHLDRFERNTEYVGLLEGAGEEALDQACDIVHPPAAREPDTAYQSGLVTQAHQHLYRALGFARVHTLALSVGSDEPEAVLLLAEQEVDGDADWTHPLHVSLGLLLPWLARMRAADRWWGARFGSWLEGQLAALIGPSHVFAKVFIVLLLAGGLYALLGSKDYRVEATAQMGTDSTRLIGASFDGFLDKVEVSSGERVREGALLATMDTRELDQQVAESRADLERFRAEADKARALGNLADMEIAHRRVAQVEARLHRLELNLTQARIVSPFDGVVVEGERKDLLGAPVRKGDHLFRLARVEGLYAVLHVPESEIRHVAAGAHGELSLLARPDREIPFLVENLIPLAQVKGQEGNQFAIKARFTAPPEAWWRPGMSGLARIEAGSRNIAWIYTHKAVDRLRMWLWW